MFLNAFYTRFALCALVWAHPVLTTVYANADGKKRDDSRSLAQGSTSKVVPSIEDSKLALDSLDRVLENSKVLRDQLRNLLLTKSRRDGGSQNSSTPKIIKQPTSLDGLSLSHGAIEKLHEDLDRQLQLQLLQDHGVGHDSTKTAVSEAKLADSDVREKENGILIPPPPWKLKLKVPPPPNQLKSPPKVKRIIKGDLDQDEARKRTSSEQEDDRDNLKPELAKDIGLQEVKILSEKSEFGKEIVPPRPKKPKADRKERTQESDFSADRASSTWGKWTSFSRCHTNLEGRCIQRRERLCSVKDPMLCAGANKFGVETQFKECVAEKCGKKTQAACVDTEDHFKCRFWAHHGKCDKNPDHMWTVCCRSCRECVDKEESCAKRASIGDCERFKKYMVKQCPSSCRVCSRLR